MEENLTQADHEVIQSLAREVIEKLTARSAADWHHASAYLDAERFIRAACRERSVPLWF